MIENHLYYEQQCTLAFARQLSDAEIDGLRIHSESCELCRDRLADWQSLDKLLFATQWRRSKAFGVPSGMRERFFARAMREGVPLLANTKCIGPKQSGLKSLVAVGGFFVLLVGVAIHVRTAKVSTSATQNAVASTLLPSLAGKTNDSVGGPLKTISTYGIRHRRSLGLRTRPSGSARVHSDKSVEPSFLDVGASATPFEGRLNLDRFPDAVSLKFAYHPTHLPREMLEQSEGQAQPFPAHLRFICNTHIISFGVPSAEGRFNRTKDQKSILYEFPQLLSNSNE